MNDESQGSKYTTSQIWSLRISEGVGCILVAIAVAILLWAFSGFPVWW